MKIKKEEKKFTHAEVYAVALDVLEQLLPFCVRAEICGSVRRGKPFPKDLELLIIPKPYTTGAVESGIALVVNRWVKVKGELVYGKTRYTQRLLPSGIKLDLFICTDETNWGYLYALRTGSADFNKKVLFSGLKSRGFKCKDGYVFRDGEKLEVREEINLFRMAGVLYKEPSERNL